MRPARDEGSSAETYDLILKGTNVVNHDGVGLRDLGIRAGRIAEGALTAPAAGERARFLETLSSQA